MPTYQYLTSDNQAEDGIATSTMTRIPSDSVYYAIKSCVRTRTDERTSVKTIRLYCRSQGIGYYKLPKYLSSIEPRFPCPFLTNQIRVLRIGQRPKRLKLPKHATKYLQVHSESESDNWSECSNEILCTVVYLILQYSVNMILNLNTENLDHSFSPWPGSTCHDSWGWPMTQVTLQQLLDSLNFSSWPMIWLWAQTISDQLMGKLLEAVLFG